MLPSINKQNKFEFLSQMKLFVIMRIRKKAPTDVSWLQNLTNTLNPLKYLTKS